MDNVIYITGEINEDTYTYFCEELLKCRPKKPVKVILNSHGGDAIAALAIASMIRKAGNVDIYVYGQAASAAVIILAYGRERFMTHEAWVMVHEDQLAKLKGSVSSLEKELAHSRRMENQWCQLLEERTETSFETWADLHKSETWLDANQCLELNLITGIV